MKNLMLLVIVSLLPLSALADSIDIPNFHSLDNAQVYRGGRPTDAGLSELKQLGVKTIIDLETTESVVDHEREQARKLGMNFVSVPLVAIFMPADEDINFILSIMFNGASGKIYVHCLEGRDRTGLVIALYRVFHDGWQPADAFQEMKNDGYHFYFFPMKWYFEKGTGWQE